MINRFSHEFNASVTVCDKEGVIIYMNRKAAELYASFGGMELMGKNLLECHSEKTRERIRHMLQTPVENHYTTEKNGVKKYVAQLPWFENGRHMGIVEIVTFIPSDMPHFVR